MFKALKTILSLEAKPKPKPKAETVSPEPKIEIVSPKVLPETKPTPTTLEIVSAKIAAFKKEIESQELESRELTKMKAEEEAKQERLRQAGVDLTNIYKDLTVARTRTEQIKADVRAAADLTRKADQDLFNLLQELESPSASPAPSAPPAPLTRSFTSNGIANVIKNFNEKNKEWFQKNIDANSFHEVKVTAYSAKGALMEEGKKVTQLEAHKSGPLLIFKHENKFWLVPNIIDDAWYRDSESCFNGDTDRKLVDLGEVVRRGDKWQVVSKGKFGSVAIPIGSPEAEPYISLSLPND